MKQFKLNRNVVGLIPAAGNASRMSPIPCSKELYPIGYMNLDKSNSEFHPKVVCHYLLEKLSYAGINKTYVVIRDGKWDIPGYLKDGSLVNMSLSYVVANDPIGVPETLNFSYDFIQDSVIAFGFPDIIFDSNDAFVRLLKKQSAGCTDIVLGLFPVENPRKWDMIEFDEKGKIENIVIKQVRFDLDYAWAIAVWSPRFTKFIRTFLTDFESINKSFKIKERFRNREMYIGDIVQAAIYNDLSIDYEIFRNDDCIDVGTPEDLVKAILKNTSDKKIGIARKISL